MKCKLRIVVLAALAALPTFSAPVVEDIVFSQDPNTCSVEVSYSLTGEQGVITADIQTNSVAGGWVSIGAENLRGLSGDLWKLMPVSAGGTKYHISWQPLETWPVGKIKKGNIRAVVKAWSTNAPPDWIVLDMANKTSFPVTYYPDEALLPCGLVATNNGEKAVAVKEYKDRYFLLKKVHAAGKTFQMGAAPLWISMGAGADQRGHAVSFTRDYYLAIYPLTKAHYAMINGDAAVDDRVVRNNLSYTGQRGSTNGAKWPVYTDGVFDFEKSHAVDSGSIIYKLRAKSGLPWLDLPTEAQWEYAAKAGTDTPLPLPLASFSTSDYTAGLDILARHAGNKNMADCEGKQDAAGATATVGSYAANPWGFYDLFGNLFEHCLDWYEGWDTCLGAGPIDQTAVFVDPVGPTKAAVQNASLTPKRVSRGGYYLYGAWNISSTCRGSVDPTYTYAYGNQSCRVAMHLK